MTMHPTPRPTLHRETHASERRPGENEFGDRTSGDPASGDPNIGRHLTIGQCATWACLLEVSIPKPGNVHRGADFDDLSFHDFAAAAVAIGPVMDRAATGAGVGRSVLDAVAATRRVAATNVNLGIALLLAPLAVVPRETSLEAGIHDVLSGLSPADASLVYEAIRLANPGGLGKVDQGDVRGPAPDDLLDAMRSAADRDAIARQYATGFRDVFGLVAPELRRNLAEGRPLGAAVIRTHLRTIEVLPDTLIARKCGPAVAAEAALYAGQVLAAREGEDGDYLEALADFDFWLRSDGHRRNPGATADLIAAGLFVLLREGLVAMPLRV
jgi:triphosphoribosyl-dephospho-CoA synthase